MTAQLKIIESIDSIKAKILFEVKEQVNKKMRGYAPVISRQVGNLIEYKLLDTPHAQSILSGQLRADFGLSEADAKSALTDLISTIRKNIRVKLDIKADGAIRNAWAMQVNILPPGLIDKLSQVGTYDSGGHSISWMKWLLTKGVSIIYEDYSIMYGSFSTSRSGQAIMAKRVNGEMFRVEPEFAGTAEDNFVVNTLSSLLPEIGLIMRKYL